jgi:hypothetical protein
MVDTGDLERLSIRAETRGMNPVKFGESPDREIEMTPSQAFAKRRKV